MKTLEFKTEDRVYKLNYKKISNVEINVLDVYEAIECEKVTGEPCSDYGFSKEVADFIAKIDTNDFVNSRFGSYNFGLTKGIYEIEGIYIDFFNENGTTEQYKKSILFIDKNGSAFTFKYKN